MVKDIHDMLQDLHQRVAALEAYPPNRPPKEVVKPKPVEVATPPARPFSPLFGKPPDKPADLTQHDNLPPHPKE